MRQPSDASSDCVALTSGRIDLDALVRWATVPAAGGVVTFSGVVRDHAEGRTDVTALTYEAYEEPAVAAMQGIVDEARKRWPACARIALVHRLGHLVLSETAVVAVVSCPHRAEAFEAAKFCIDTLKESVPIWKQEHWADGSGWAVDEQPLRTLGSAAGNAS